MSGQGPASGARGASADTARPGHLDTFRATHLYTLVRRPGNPAGPASLRWVGAGALPGPAGNPAHSRGIPSRIEDHAPSRRRHASAGPLAPTRLEKEAAPRPDPLTDSLMDSGRLPVRSGGTDRSLDGCEQVHYSHKDRETSLEGGALDSRGTGPFSGAANSCGSGDWHYRTHHGGWPAATPARRGRRAPQGVSTCRRSSGRPYRFRPATKWLT
jgi:hypothetical protein